MGSSSQSQSEDESLEKRVPSKSRSRSRSHSPRRERHRYRESTNHGRKEGYRYHHDLQEERRPKIITPGLDGPLLSYKHFMELQRDPIEPEEAERHYNDYKNRHIEKQNKIFFEHHKVLLYKVLE
jgi:hypothetical protein